MRDDASVEVGTESLAAEMVWSEGLSKAGSKLGTGLLRLGNHVDSKERGGLNTEVCVTMY